MLTKRGEISQWCFLFVFFSSRVFAPTPPLFLNLIHTSNNNCGGAGGGAVLPPPRTENRHEVQDGDA